MGKKVKKKGRTPTKEKKVAIPSTEGKPIGETIEGAVEVVVKERRPCPHLEKGVDLEKVSAKIKSSKHITCEDCKEGSKSGRGGKGKSKHGKNKGSSSSGSKSESKAIWICLECGHYACGGIGLPTSAQYHVPFHVRSTRHRLMMHLGNPHLRWCFSCNELIPYEKSEKDGENKDILAEVVKLIKNRSSEEESSVDVEDAWFGSGSVTSEVKLEATALTSIDGENGYVVRGLVNLGNTCFFNSVVQNLFTLHQLQDYFFNQDVCPGPMTISLKKLFAETKPEVGLRSVINPRSFFGYICSKAPQFKGYQQQDSHELLRCLLDGLSMEESGLRKKLSSSDGGGDPSIQSPTFVNAVFGGQISSTVCCLECGHSSTVYEPCLDFSLSVPTKKPPFKKAQPTSRSKKAKKTKLPPKRGGRVHSKVIKDADTVPAKTIINSSASVGLPAQENLDVPLEKMVIDDCTQSASVGLVSEASSAPTSQKEQPSEYESQQITDLADNFTWLDYVEPETTLHEDSLMSKDDSISFTEELKDKDMGLNDALMETKPIYAVGCEPNAKDNYSSENFQEEELPLQVNDSGVLLLPYKEENFATDERVREEAEASLSAVDYEQEELGFGDLFNEPEAVEGPVFGPSLQHEGVKTGFTAANISDSDQDEVDDTDSPVSIESCLAHFIKPELLSNDNAWVCENCSKSLHRRRLEAKKASKNSRTLQNGVKSQCQINSGHNEAKKRHNSDVSTDSEPSVSHCQEMDCSSEICVSMGNEQTAELNPGETTDVSLKQQHISGVPEGASSSSCTDSPNGAIELTEQNEQTSELMDGICESEESDNEEMISKTVKVKRDATKRVLIDKAPLVLTIHLKRFSQDSRGRLTKLNGHVIFKELLDLGPYMDPRCLDDEKYIYRLVGIVEHSGSMRGGHYVAYVRGGGKNGSSSAWYHASDAYVRQASIDEVLRCEAYILFYERI